MTNAQLNTLINTIDTGGLNTALEVRNVLLGIKNEMFTDYEIINGTNGDLGYTLFFKKTGNLVILYAELKNNATYLLDLSSLNNIIIPLKYKAQPNQKEISINILPNLYLSLYEIDLIFKQGVIPGDATFNFSLTYLSTND